jgi:hypothetical protein
METCNAAGIAASNQWEKATAQARWPQTCLAERN